VADLVGLHQPARTHGPAGGRPLQPRYGLFSGEDVLGGQPVKVRFIWKDITASSARFEQAFSYDDGQSWATNWIIIVTAHA
jgi:hypothetical protein